MKDHIIDAVCDDGNVLHLTKLARLGVSPTLYVDINGIILHRSHQPDYSSIDGLRDLYGYAYTQKAPHDETTPFYILNEPLIHQRKQELEELL